MGIFLVLAISFVSWKIGCISRSARGPRPGSENVAMLLEQAILNSVVPNEYNIFGGVC